MSESTEAFIAFKQLVSSLKDWGYDVRDDGEFGEFALAGFVCSYRFFGVLDVNFLLPGELLADRVEPDMVLAFDGRNWEELTEDALPMLYSTAELYRTCVRTINFLVASQVGINPGTTTLPRSA